MTGSLRISCHFSLLARRRSLPILFFEPCGDPDDPDRQNACRPAPSPIASEFAKAHAAEIKKAYKVFPVAKPDFFGLTRPALKIHLEAYEAALVKKDHAAAREFLERSLRPGLWKLAPTIIPDTWI